MLLNLLLWALTLYLAYTFFKAGYAKVTNDPSTVGAFEAIGALPTFTPEQFRKFTGGIEILASVFLIIPPLTTFGSALLVCTMIGALIAHKVVFKGGYQKPALLLAGAFILTVLRW